ncbi:hypothetical protein VTO58DRAFT_109056 [Aureobasidium pullulans]|nr:hypothetical protein JADG_009105 [Aureobasidium pullulans]THX78899.1 hypothetical protein D6D05_05178 [Aureobasidium pullulans]
MGRLQPTVVVTPQANRRSDRAKRAKETVNKVIPDLLKSSPRARHGIHNAVLTSDPKPEKDIKSSTSNLTIRLCNTDSLTAARRLTHSSRRQSAAAALTTSKQATRSTNVCILNMASPLRPGGGFLDGATSSEEFLCMRTTLYASLWDDFYRLPELGGIVTPDVLVHRDSTPEAEDLPKRERFFVDIISAAMIRFPETNSARLAEKEEADGSCSCGVSYCDRDRELVTHKMRGVLRMAQARGAEKLILGAWGCGAYGNPVREVAKIWKRVILGTTRKAESWPGIKEIVFAITDRGQLKEFEKCFGDVLAKESVSPPPEVAQDARSTGTQSPTSELISELVSKIQETELQLDQMSNPRSKARLREVLANLNKQLSQAGSGPEEDEMPPDPIGEEVEDASYPDAAGGFEGEEGGYYNFDSSDIASSGSVSPSTSDIYEFRVPGTSVPNKSVESHMTDDFEHVGFDTESGWFSGSINGLSSLLAKQRRGGSGTSPVLRGEGGLDDVEPLGFGSGLSDYLQRYSEQGSY